MKTEKLITAAKVLVVLVFLVFLITPLFFVVSCSFKPSDEFTTVKGLESFVPKSPTISNYQEFFDGTFFTTFLNSLTICAISLSLTLAVAFPVAYCFARVRFLASNHLFFWFLSTRFAPVPTFIIPFFILYKNLGLVDSVFGIALAHTLFNVPLAILLLTSFIRMIPESVDKSAFLDGLGWTRFFRKVLIPNLKTGLIATAFFVWIFSWTELVFGLGLSVSYQSTPLSVEITRAMAEIGGKVDWGPATAASVISFLPGLVFLALYTKYITKGFTLGRV